MNLTGIVGAALLAAALALLLRKQNAEQAMALGLIAGVLIAIEILKEIFPAVRQIQSLLEGAGISNEFGSILLKTLGISFLVQFASDACRDAGETALASKVELAGRAEILILALPLFQRIAATATSLVGA